MRYVNAAVVVALVGGLPVFLQAQQPAPHSWQSLRVELGYSHYDDGVGPGVGGMFKFVHAMGQNGAVAFDVGIVAAKEFSGADWAAGIDGGIELRPHLSPSVQLLLGFGAGLATPVGEYVDAYTRLSGGFEFSFDHSPLTLRTTLHTGIPPFQHESINAMVLVGAEYRLSARG